MSTRSRSQSKYADDYDDDFDNDFELIYKHFKGQEMKMI